MGMVPCSWLWPGLCPHPMLSPLPRAPGWHQHPTHRVSPQPSLPCHCPRAPWLLMANGDAFVPPTGCAHSLGDHGGLGAAQAQPHQGHPKGGRSGRALSQGRGGRCLNTICFVGFGPASHLTSLCTSLATSCGHSAGATHGPGHGAPRGVGTPWRSLYIASKRKKKMKCENNDRFK